MDAVRVFVNVMGETVRRIEAGDFFKEYTPEFRRGAAAALRLYIESGSAVFLDPPAQRAAEPKQGPAGIRLVVDNTAKKKPRAGGRRRGAKQPQHSPQPEK
ncbi:hypothetical protein [Aquimonas voraii]|uniref:hypothetical protein n=1 Tax=Aquimonas voraii TaxID=265719 RepID=UPI00115FC98A|nr:hypothetical protein [Aquimonas voraii]